MNNEVKKFFKYVMYFIPLAVLILILHGITMLGGEELDFDRVYERQNQENSDILFGPAYTNFDVEYKTYCTLRKNPDTLILGSSRVMQFDIVDFPGTAYNAGGAVHRIGQYPDFISYIISQGIKPDLLIIGLDQNYFNEKSEYVADSSGNYIMRLRHNNVQPTVNLMSVLKDLVKGKIDIVKILNNEFVTKKYIGINAIMNQNGFKPSGSYYYGGLYIHKDYHDKDFSNTYSRIEAGAYLFEYGNEINPRAIKKLEKLLAECKKNNIEVIAIIPPYAPTIYKHMMKTGKYEYINKLYPMLQPLFEEYDFNIFDFSYMDEVTDAEFVDGFHGGDSVYKKITKEILDKQ